MADVRGVNTTGAPPPSNRPVDEPTARQPGVTQPTGPPGELGQPTGMPAPSLPGHAKVLSDVLAGQDPSQLRAAELLRENGGVSATEKLLGLDLQPSIPGAFIAPPGNTEALRHMTVTMRRTAMRNLLLKQRDRMRRLQGRLQRENGENEEQEDDAYPEASAEVLRQTEKARRELTRAGAMLTLLEELLAMQDYTISQMGTFSKG
ncbi:MAG TPA: hypothetical protein VKB46_21165 [Pyrinomonadaceae bacterium]|nr:hypothetical protein [Pyrinomonadaceae bacterium]